MRKQNEQERDEGMQKKNKQGKTMGNEGNKMRKGMMKGRDEK